MAGDDPTDTIDLENPDRVRIGATRGEFNTEIGRPRDYPDSADLSIQPEGDNRILLTVDATTGDHGSGHADIEFTLEEAQAISDLLEETARWMAEE